MRSDLRPPAALALFAVVVAGCGSGTAGTGGGTAAATPHQRAVQFAECMRTNGVSQFPDPTASGAFTIDGVVNGSSLDPNGPAWKRAIGACKDLEPAGFTGPKVTPQQQTVRLRFARCMRDNGVPDFPDPAPNGPLIDTTRIPSLAGRNPRTDPGFQAAQQKCGGLYGAELGIKRP